MNTKKITDRDLELIMGNLLRYGVLLSALIVATGGIIYLFQYGHQIQDYRNFESEPERLRNISTIWNEALRGHGRSVIQLGLLVLIATPIARIVFSIIGYLLERDYLYILITLAVLCIILFSL
jgi:uncharacterized membrane protein